MKNERKIIHIEMDAFFAAIEQRDKPELQGKPVVVGGSPDSRGVVSTASYEARKFGVHSAMPSAQARRLCPEAIFVFPRMEAYRHASQQIMDILRHYTDLVEPLSLDEAYLDVTENKLGIPSATDTAKAIRKHIFEATKLTASAGVAPNKFLAKVASDMNKPDGLTVITPSMVEKTLETLPVRNVPGIGRVTEKKMTALGVHTTKDIQRFSEEELVQWFGKVGSLYYRLARGIDPRPVVTEHVRKSIGAEDTFEDDTTDTAWMKEKLSSLAERVSRRLERNNASGRTITLKVTYSDFERVTRSRTLNQAVWDPATLEELAVSLLAATDVGVRPVRLLGITVSNLDVANPQEASLKKEACQLEFPFNEQW